MNPQQIRPSLVPRIEQRDVHRMDIERDYTPAPGDPALDIHMAAALAKQDEPERLDGGARKTRPEMLPRAKAALQDAAAFVKEVAAA